MALVSLQDVSLAFGGNNIIDHLNFQVEPNQRVCLLGRNGAGKSTLMKIISGVLPPDSGSVHKDPTLRIAYFEQHIPMDLNGTAFDIIAGGLGERGSLLLEYHQQTLMGSAGSNDLHSRMDAMNVWKAYDEIHTIASRIGLDLEALYQNLSGGQKRRVLLAKALVSDPDLLLLDEPTNHLDIEAIAWLESYLLRMRITLLFVTHDRLLLKRLATRIIELDRGKLTDWSCDYETFIQRKQSVLEAEEKEWERFDKKLAQEEIWIRKGIRARRTRNEGRVRALKKMREERRQRRQREGQAQMILSEAEHSGKIVLKAEHVSFSYGDKIVLSDFNALIARGDKIGIIGPNGCGKTTLINVLLGKLQPQRGRVTPGTKLQTAYFDQMRAQLDESKTVWENVLPNGNMVSVNGKDRHIVSYLQDFLFTTERSKTPVRNLSGGERNRLLLARLFTEPANLLVFDEPTNDLDAETLELLEDRLMQFNGTILLISHDRAFLNNVVTSTLVFEGSGIVKEYVGGYDDWLLQKQNTSKKPAQKTNKKKLYQKEKRARQKKQKLSFKEEQELQKLPALIESLETEMEMIHSKMSDPNLYRIKDEIVALKQRLNEIELALKRHYERWECLEEIGDS